jgi:tricorn protease
MARHTPAAPGAPASPHLDWDDLHLRVNAAAGITANEGAINVDGSKVAFRSGGSSGDDLWVANANGSQLTRITTGSVRPTQITWSKRSSSTIYFRDSFGSLRVASVGGFGTPSEPSRVTFTAKLTIRQHEEFAEMFEQSWRALAEHFYDPNHHGVNWRGVYDKYRPLVKHVGTKEDLYALISLMLGELNASHLGISGFGRVPDELTADLGILYDESYAGPGLKVAEILKRGPADRRGLGLKTGDVIVSIANAPITPSTNLSALLNDQGGETVVVHYVPDGVDPKDPKARKRVEITASDRSTMAKLMYERWVEKNAQRVSEISKGTLGYIHIPSMDDAGLDAFVRALYSDNFDKEAIVLDVRYNGGGFTHDQVLNYLGAKEHTFFRQRHGGVGPVLRSYDRKWSKPLVLLINNRSYSDAEIFPSAFRTLGLGKLVGQPTGGLVIGTSSIRLIDGSTFRIPRTGVFTLKGVNMEKEGVSPDILIEPHPDELAKGRDVQLDKAVEVLQADVALWKKTHLARQLEEIKSAPAIVSPEAK